MAKKKVDVIEVKEMRAISDDKLKEFSKNFKETCQILGLSQQKLRIMTGKSVGFINNICNGKASPEVDFMANLLSMPPFSDFEEHNTNPLMIDSFFCDDCKKFAQDYIDDINNPDSVVKPKRMSEFVRKDMVGAYMIYLFDQSKENYTENEKASRRIRFGVVSIVEEVCLDYGVKTSFKAYAHFFKEKNDAVKLHKKLSKIFKTSLKGEKIDIPKLAKSIENEYIKVGVNPTDSIYSAYKNKEYYQGDVDFQEQHVYIDLKSSYFGDHALFALYSPPKKKDSDYIGGIASLSSVSHGNDRMPCAQKALVSRYIINKDDVELGEYIRMNPTKVSIETKIEEIYSMFEELNKESLSGLMDRQDKLSIFSNRFERIVKDYIKDGLNSVGVITTADDSAAYELIKHFGMHND